MQGESDTGRSAGPSRPSSTAGQQASQPLSRGPSFRAGPAAEEARRKGPAVAKKEPTPPEHDSHTTEMFAHLPPFKVGDDTCSLLTCGCMLLLLPSRFAGNGVSHAR